MKSLSALTLLLLITLGAITYAVKNRVNELEGMYLNLQRDIVAMEESLHMLECEWAFLTRPERLQTLLVQQKMLHPLDGFELVRYENAGELTSDQVPEYGKAFHASIRTR